VWPPKKGLMAFFKGCTHDFSFRTTFHTLNMTYFLSETAYRGVRSVGPVRRAARAGFAPASEVAGGHTLPF
jgi:hypothetical protein